MKIHHTVEQSPEEKAASARGRRSRRKGHDFERELVRLFGDCLPECFTVQRMLQARGGGGLPDVEIRLNGDPLLHLEAKHGKQPNIRKALDQAIHDAHRGAMPVAVTKADRGQTLVTMDVQCFIQLLKWLDCA